MSIQESTKAIKSPEANSPKSEESRIFEGEFDIVPLGEVQEGGLGKDILWYALILILVAFGAFGLGRLSALETGKSEGVVIRGGEMNTTSSNETSKIPVSSAGEVQGAEDGAVVASKSGSKYHYPWCAGAKQIAEKNKITFNSIEEARAAGYTPAANCKGLK